MSPWASYIITFLSGGLAGAFVNRHFALKDRAIKTLTLKIIKEDMRSIIPVSIRGKQYQNLVYKMFTLVNSTKDDFPQLDIVFEFDKNAEIVSKEVTSKKHGKNNFAFTEKKPSELVYHIKNFNRKQEISFVFEVANITEGFFCPYVDNCGVEINIVRKRIENQPGISLTRIVTKLDLDNT